MGQIHGSNCPVELMREMLNEMLGQMLDRIRWSKCKLNLIFEMLDRISGSNCRVKFMGQISTRCGSRCGPRCAPGAGRAQHGASTGPARASTGQHGPRPGQARAQHGRLGKSGKEKARHVMPGLLGLLGLRSDGHDETAFVLFRFALGP